MGHENVCLYLSEVHMNKVFFTTIDITTGIIIYMIVGYNTHESILKTIINDCRKDEYSNNIRKVDTMRRSTKIHPKDGSLASYRPQLLFLQVCVKNSVHGGGELCIQACTRAPPASQADTPHGQTPPVPPGRHPPHGHCSGRYASYWNAFSFKIIFWWILRTILERRILCKEALKTIWRTGL